MFCERFPTSIKILLHFNSCCISLALSSSSSHRYAILTMANDWFVWPGNVNDVCEICISRNRAKCLISPLQLNRNDFHENFLFFFFAGRRRVSLRRSPQLNNCPTSASSHYSSICKLSLVIPVILLLLSTTIDVTGKWFMLKFTSTFFSVVTLWRMILCRFYAFCWATIECMNEGVYTDCVTRLTVLIFLRSTRYEKGSSWKNFSQRTTQTFEHPRIHQQPEKEIKQHDELH